MLASSSFPESETLQLRAGRGGTEYYAQSISRARISVSSTSNIQADFCGPRKNRRGVQKLVSLAYPVMLKSEDRRTG